MRVDQADQYQRVPCLPMMAIGARPVGANNRIFNFPVSSAMIPFNKPPYTGKEDDHVLNAMRASKMSGTVSIRCSATSGLKVMLAVKGIIDAFLYPGVGNGCDSHRYPARR